MDRLFYMCAAGAGFLGVALGAFGAHALRARLSPEMLAVFETAVRYQMYHAFALVAAAWGWSRWRRAAFGAAGWAFLAGIVVFCGSLYWLALGGPRATGAVAPLGGLAFLTGWLCLLAGAWTSIRE